MPEAITGGTTVLTDLKGPDLLEAYAERNANQGFLMEAQILNTVARQWREERGESAPPSKYVPLVSHALAPAKAILCKVKFSNVHHKVIQLEVQGDFRKPTGPCWLVPLEPVS
jgi:hypothetical protein